MKASKGLKKPASALMSIVKEEPVAEGRLGLAGAKKPSTKGKGTKPRLDSVRRDKLKRKAKKGVVALR
jgi:hypothetical protein